MDFETEIKIISSKALEPDADFKRLNTQLMVLMQTLRGLNLKDDLNGKQNQRPGRTNSRKKILPVIGVKPRLPKVKSKKLPSENQGISS